MKKFWVKNSNSFKFYGKWPLNSRRARNMERIEKDYKE